tara:strand:- start:267 stop:512 length:246 start_codon:yes stop_codon:yes gene_type:complete
MAIQFIGAHNGGIMAVVNGNDCFCENEYFLAFFMVNHQYKDAYFLSSMDFASEEGFANDGDAKAMFSKAEAIANKIKEEAA